MFTVLELSWDTLFDNNSYIYLIHLWTYELTYVIIVTKYDIIYFFNLSYIMLAFIFYTDTSCNLILMRPMNHYLFFTPYFILLLEINQNRKNVCGLLFDFDKTTQFSESQ